MLAYRCYYDGTIYYNLTICTKKSLMTDLGSSKWESDNVAEKTPQVVYDMQKILRRERQK